MFDKEVQKKKLKKATSRCKYILTFRHQDIDKFGHKLYDNLVKKYCVIRANDINGARKIAELYRGKEYLTVTAVSEMVSLKLWIHPIIEEVKLDQVDITADYWNIINMTGEVVTTIRLEKGGTISQMKEKILKALVSAMPSIKNKTQIEVWHDAVDDKYIWKLKGDYPPLYIKLMKKTSGHEITELTTQ